MHKGLINAFDVFSFRRNRYIKNQGLIYTFTDPEAETIVKTISRNYGNPYLRICRKIEMSLYAFIFYANIIKSRYELCELNVGTLGLFIGLLL